MKNSLHIGLFTLFILLLISCENNKKENPKNKSNDKINYKIIDEVKTETHNKAQLVEYAVYSDTIYTEKAIEKVLLDIYSKNKDKDLFDKFDTATVFGVYVFTSTEMYENDKSAWIGMLLKKPRNDKPTLSYSKHKLKSLQGLNDNIKSDDEIAYEKLTKHLNLKGLELCSFYKTLGDMELECIHKADAKYPNFDYPQHGDYTDKLIELEKKKIMKKYKLKDSVFFQVAIYGMNYCK